MLKALTLLKEVSHVRQPLLYTRVIDNAANRRAAYRQGCVSPSGFIDFSMLKCNAAKSGFVF